MAPVSAGGAAFPYRFRVTEGTMAGTTFIYYKSGRVITYRTDSPEMYHQSKTSWTTEVIGNHVILHQEIEDGLTVDMTPEDLAEFEAIPTLIEQQARADRNWSDYVDEAGYA